MKVRIEYTAHLSEEDLIAIAEHGYGTSRSDLRTLFQHLGEMGIEEIVAEGNLCLECRKIREEEQEEFE